MKQSIILLVFNLMLLHFNVTGQSMSEQLQHSFIWSGNNDAKGSYTVFRKSFESKEVSSAMLNIFADARYLLWINGKEVLRGPCRFDPKGPQYDFMNVAKYLQKGKNTIAVLVMSHGSNGKMMDHVPGLTLSLNINSKGQNQIIKTDESWLWNNHTRYLPAKQTWGFVSDHIDARLDDGDWTTNDYNDTKWSKAKLINGTQWGALEPRQIPLLGQQKVPVHLLHNRGLPTQILSGYSAILLVDRMVQGFANFDFHAYSGDTILIEMGYTTDSTNITGKNKVTHLYIAKEGRQQYSTTDSYGFHFIKFTSKNSAIQFNSVEVIDRRYPYVEAGSFTSNDAFLNELWTRSSLTMLMNSEDGYMDCALREKTEWMGDAAVVQYPVSRVLFGYPDKDQIIRSDAGLMKNMIRHIAQSQTDSGTLKAHHPSDRWDIHGYIEDYSCQWVQSLRQVYDNTGDKALVQEVWEHLKKQMNWFMLHQTTSGLLLAREFVIFDNPISYVYCEGATLNAFYYKALLDASYLAKVVADSAAAELYAAKASALFKSYNQNLWIEEQKTYAAGMSNGKQLLPTAHAALLALQMGIVPEERQKEVELFLLNNYLNTGFRTEIRKNRSNLLEAAFNVKNKVNGINMPYTSFWLLDVLYNTHHDSLALKFIRTKWALMMKQKQTGTLSEGFDNGDLCHNFGAVPAYFLSSKVLGASTILPLKNKQIQIQPQLGDLSYAEGTVVTELGLVKLNWKKSAKKLAFSITVPKGVKAKVLLPKASGNTQLHINNKQTKWNSNSNLLSFELGEGKYTGEVVD